MIRTFLILTLLIGAFSGSASARSGDDVYSQLLSRYVIPSADGVNRVDYEAWNRSKPDRQALDAYIAELAKAAPAKLERPQAFAYWANLYNALTLKVILDAYPVASIRDIKSDAWLDPKAWLGPWRTKRVSVEGRSLSLDDIEHEIMRPTFKDPRVHYAVNCASIGCPNLMARPWSAATLEADLDDAARAFVNHPRGARIVDGRLQVSSIYRWFIADFGGDDAGVIAHLKAYASPGFAKQLEQVNSIAEDQYDWALNGGSQPRS